MKRNTTLAFMALLLLSGTVVGAQTTLAAGDIVITGFNMDNPDQFTFVPLVDLQSSTVITFTDSGWLSTGSFRGNEGGVTYTASSAVSMGTLILFNGIAGDWTNGNDATIGNNGLAFSTSGDQILAFQGLSTSPTFIYGVNSSPGTATWDANATDSSTSALPSGLTNGTSAVALDGDVDNYDYTGSRTQSTAAAIRTDVGNNANWTGNNNIITLDTGGFTSLPIVVSSYTFD